MGLLGVVVILVLVRSVCRVGAGRTLLGPEGTGSRVRWLVCWWGRVGCCFGGGPVSPIKLLRARVLVCGVCVGCGVGFVGCLRTAQWTRASFSSFLWSSC